MLDEKTIELIQADVDGELPAQYRAELSRCLLANPEARALRDELERLCRVLARVPAADPPAGLRASILSASGLPAGAGGLRRFRAPAGLFRLAAAFAGGLIAGGLVLQAAVDGRPGLDISQVAGTMVSQDPVATSAPVDTLEVSLEPVSGAVSLFRSPGMRVVEFDLSARQPVEVVVTYDGGRQARFSGFGQPGAAGTQRYALVLDGPGQAGSPVGLRFYASGTLIHEDALAVPAPR